MIQLKDTASKKTKETVVDDQGSLNKQMSSAQSQKTTKPEKQTSKVKDGEKSNLSKSPKTTESGKGGTKTPSESSKTTKKKL